MIWINITEADLRNSKASALIDAYASAALGDTQTDPVPDAIASVCQTIRTKVQSCQKNRISLTANAIPPSLKRMALRLICWEMQSRLNVSNSLPPSDQDKTDHQNDLQELERIAECKVVIETPDDPQPVSDVQRAGSIQMGTAARSCTRVTTRDRLRTLCIAGAIALLGLGNAGAQTQQRISALTPKPAPSPTDVMALVDTSGRPWKTTVAQLLAGVGGGGGGVSAATQALNVVDFGATSSTATTILTANAASGSTSVTLADASTFAVGQGIWIAGAFASTSGYPSTNYLGTINTIVANVVTITPATTASVSTGAIVKHENSANIQAAVNATPVAGGTVYAPAGIYHCSIGITLRQRGNFVGAGMGSIAGDPVTAASNSTVLDFTDLPTDSGGWDNQFGLKAPGNNWGIELRDFKLYGPQGNPSNTGISIPTGFGLKMTNVGVHHFGIQVLLNTTYVTRLDGVNTQGQNGTTGLWLITCDGVQSFNSLYANCFYGPNIKIEGGQDLHFYDSVVDEAFNGQPTIQIASGSDISFNNSRVFASHAGTGGNGFGFLFGNGTVAPTRVTLNNVRLEMYTDGVTNWPQYNLWLRGSGHRLVNVSTQLGSGAPSSADIRDDTSDSQWFNVNGRHKLRLPTSASGLASGTLYSNAGVVTVAP